MIPVRSELLPPKRPDELVSERPPILPTDQNFALIAVVTSKDGKSALNILGCFKDDKAVDKHIVDLWDRDYNRFNLFKVPTGRWGVFPPPPEAGAGTVSYHQPILREIMKDHTAEAELAEARMDQRLQTERMENGLSQERRAKPTSKHGKGPL